MPSETTTTGASALSPRRLATNRQNAQKSTGPRTPAGKQTSAHNAATHLAFRADLVQPRESAAFVRTFRVTRLDATPRNATQPLRAPAQNEPTRPNAKSVCPIYATARSLALVVPHPCNRMQHRATRRNNSSPRRKTNPPRDVPKCPKTSRLLIAQRRPPLPRPG
jgi:hypothetical protein